MTSTDINWYQLTLVDVTCSYKIQGVVRSKALASFKRIVFIINKIQALEQKQLWLSRISDFAESGLTQVQWANQKNISVSTLRYWIRRLREPEENESQNWLQVEIPQGNNIASLPLSGASKIQQRTKAFEALIM